MTSNSVLFLVLAAAIVSSFLLSGIEAGVMALNRLRIRHRARSGDRAAAMLREFLDNPEAFLWTILVGNALANSMTIVLLFLILHRWLEGRWWWLLPMLFVGGFLIYTFAELLPKMLFRRFPNRLCLLLARPFKLVHALLSPVVWVLERSAKLLQHGSPGNDATGLLFRNRDELRLVMRDSGANLGSAERSMIERVLDLQKTLVGDIMVPMPEAVTVTRETPLSDLFNLCKEKDIDRLPVREPSTGRILGLVTLQNTLYHEAADPVRAVGDFVQPAVFMDDSLHLDVALQRMRQSGHRMAIVLGADRREVGLLTLEDLLRFMFGDLRL